MNLTRQQRRVVDAPGDLLVLACPGSGKTRAAGARAARLAEARISIAICSYTNVGANRIARVLADELAVVLGPEHYIGTIHGYLLRYVLYPFAHLYGAEAGPVIWQEGSWPDVTVGRDARKRIPLDAFRLRPDRSLVLAPGRKPRSVPEDADTVVRLVGDEVKSEKRRLFRQGIISSDDAMYISLQILRNRPGLAAHVAGRFRELLLDEAQDTSELQLACVDLIRGSGRLSSLVMVGDVEQSIFSFQGASAEGCQLLAAEHGLRTIELSENHRSSQRICNVAAHFCARPTADRAVGPDATCEIEPEVCLYPRANPRAALDLYRSRLAAYAIEVDDATVLARGRALVRELNGEVATVEMEPSPARLGRVTSALRCGTFGEADLRWAQALLTRCALGVEIGQLDDELAETTRPATYRFLQSLPDFARDLRSWIRESAAALDVAARSLRDPPAHHAGHLLRSSADHAAVSAREAFERAPSRPSAQTVHDIKGEERGAVMVVIDRPRGAFGSQATLWGAAVAGEPVDTSQAEELRIAFVALSRARRYCLVALPDDANGRAAEAAFIGAGFRRIEPEDPTVTETEEATAPDSAR